MHSKLAVILLLSLTSASGLSAITLEECLKTGLEQSRTASQIAAELARQRAVAGLPKADFAPKLSVTRSSGRLGNDTEKLSQKLSSRTEVVAQRDRITDDVDRRSLLLSQSIFVNNSIELDRANYGWAIARIDRDQSLEDYKFSVIGRFYDVLRSQERVETLTAAVDRWKRALAFAEAKFQLGTTNKIDVLNTRVNLGASENALLTELQSLERRRDELRDLIGLPRSAPAVAQEKLEFQKLEERPAAIERREVAVNRLKVRLTSANLKAARQDRAPDVRVNTGYTEGPGYAPEMVASVSYNFSLGRRREDYEFFRLQADLRSARIALADREAEVERDQRDVVRILQLTEQAIALARERLAQAEESYDYSMEAFSKGLITNLDLRDSQEKLTQARDALTGLLIDYKIARYRYVKAFGGTL